MCVVTQYQVTLGSTGESQSSHHNGWGSEITINIFSLQEGYYSEWAWAEDIMTWAGEWCTDWSWAEGIEYSLSIGLRYGIILVGYLQEKWYSAWWTWTGNIVTWGGEVMY